MASVLEETKNKLRKIKSQIFFITNPSITPIPVTRNPLSKWTYFTGRQSSFFKRLLSNPRLYSCESFTKVKKGHIELSDPHFDYDSSQEKPKSHFPEKAYSFSYTMPIEQIDPKIFDYIYENKAFIEDALGPGFLVNLAQLWRNVHIPHDQQHKDYFSNLFHQDNWPDPLCIKFFLLLSPVSSTQGPFEWVDFENGKQFFEALRYRSVNKVDNLPVNRLTGERGDCLIINTSYLFHRASIPEPNQERTIFQLDFYPKDTKLGVPWKNYDRFHQW